MTNKVYIDLRDKAGLSDDKMYRLLRTQYRTNVINDWRHGRAEMAKEAIELVNNYIKYIS